MPRVLKFRLLIIIVCIVVIILCINALPYIQADIIGPESRSGEDVKPSPSNGPGNGKEPDETQGPVATQKPEESKLPDINDIAVLVNKTHELPSDFEPMNLVQPDVRFVSGAVNRLMREEAADALEQLFTGAEEAGFRLYALSGYRKYSYQKQLFELNVERYGSIEVANMYSAKPGQSEHQTGLAMDITSESVDFDLVEEFGDMPEGKWLAANAHKYGFIIRFPKGKEHITGYAYEPWHVRFLGVDLATKVYNSGLTYEEYLGVVPGTGND